MGERRKKKQQQRERKNKVDSLEERLKRIEKGLEKVRERAEIPKKELRYFQKERKMRKPPEFKEEIEKKEKELEKEGLKGKEKQYHLNQFKRQKREEWRRKEKFEKQYPEIASKEEFEKLTNEEKSKIFGYSGLVKREELKEMVEKAGKEGKTVEKAIEDTKNRILEETIKDLKSKREKMKELEQKLDKTEGEKKEIVKRQIRQLDEEATNLFRRADYLSSSRGNHHLIKK